MNPSLLQDVEAFFTTGPGIVLLRTLAILSALGALGVLLRLKPRGEWKRAAAVAVAAILFHGLVLLTDLSSLGTTAGIMKSFTANVGRSSSFLLALAAVWFFLAPRRNPTGDTLAIVVAILGLLASVVSSGSFILFGGDIPYNNNWISLLWDGGRGLLLAVAILLLIVRRPSLWGVSLCALTLLLAGVIVQASLSNPGLYLPGLAGLFDVLAVPFIAMRLALSASSAILAPAAPPVPSAPAAPGRSTTAESIPLLADLLLTSEEDMPQALAAWLTGAMQVEICLLVTRAEEGTNLLFFAGHDRLYSRELPVFTLPAESSLKLFTAVTNRQRLHIGPSEAETILQPVAAAAGLDRPGPGLYAPLNTPGDIPMGILLMAPYSQEDWKQADEQVLGQFIPAGTAAFQRTHAISLMRQDIDNAAGELERAKAETASLQQTQANLEMRLQQAEQEWQKERERAESLSARLEELETAGGPEGEAARAAAMERRAKEAADHEEEAVALLRRELDRVRADLAAARIDADRLPEAIQAAASFRDETLRLQSELQRVRTQMESQQGQQGSDAVTQELLRLHAVLEETEQRANAEIERLQSELRRTLAEYGHLQSALLQPPPGADQTKGISAEVGPESGMVASLISEIRQPLSSMVGYADLLLSESAGILGAMQRKFLERIRASTTRTEALFDDLLQLILLPGKVSAPRIQPVDVPSLIDAAVTGVSDMVREKGIILRLDIDEDMPPVEMDRDALQQIINHLVQNAVLATPPEKEVFLTAHAPLSDQASRRALLLTVKDSGPGVSAEDQPRVFTRLYRTEGPILEGLGDTGVGLAVARTLTEALGGRIWLESTIGQGATFFVLLPTQASPGGNPG